MKSASITSKIVLILSALLSLTLLAPRSFAAPPAQSPSNRKPTAQPSHGSISLIPKWTKGSHTRYRFTQQASRKTSGGDLAELNQSNTLNQELVLVLHVLDTPPTPQPTKPKEPSKNESPDTTPPTDLTTIELTIESAQAQIESDGSTASASKSISQTPSRSNPSPQPAKKPQKSTHPSKPAHPSTSSPDPDLQSELERWVDSAVGSKITFKVDPSGKIVSVEGGSELGGQSSMLDPSSTMTGNPVESLKWLVRSLGETNAPHTVRSGDSWINNDLLDKTPLGGFSMKTTHQVRSISRGIADINFSGQIATDHPENSSPLGNLVQIRKAAYSGQYQWDSNLGQLKSMNADLNVELSLSTSLPSPSNQPSQSAGISAQSSSRISFDRIESPKP